jgi:hypothetical protein
MDSYIPYFKDTTRKNGNYKLLQCKACIWLISNPSLHEITLTKDFNNPRERERVDTLLNNEELESETIVIDDEDDTEQLETNTLEDPLVLFADIEEPISDDDFGSDEDIEASEITTETTTVPVPSSIILRIQGPTYNPIDKSPNFWIPTRYDYVNKIYRYYIVKNPRTFTRNQHQKLASRQDRVIEEYSRCKNNSQCVMCC